MRTSRQTTSLSLTARMGGWLPMDPKVLNRWLKELIDEAEKARQPFHAVVNELQRMIESDPIMTMYFTQMFQQQPVFPPPPGSGDVKLKDYQQLLTVLNHVLTHAPSYNTTGMVGFPINAVLDFPMITPAGLAAFTMEKVNHMFRKYFAVWTEFLNGPKSREVLNTGPRGWLSPAAKEALHLDDFVTHPGEPYDGFKSWNDFFIRQFKPGKRPVAAPQDDAVIASACESAPYAIQYQVNRNDTFWAKGQPYSLQDMLGGHHVDQFVGGTVYQAFLSAENYHRWHSPVNGTIRDVVQVPGTYYAEAASEGFDPAGPNDSQGYIAHVATRALIFIEADNPAIGLMCVIPIGMAEVSSCLVVGADGQPLKPGQRVKKGEQIGYFQFGGSTHCLVFGPQADVDFVSRAIPQGANGSSSGIVKVNSYLATVR